MQRNLHINTKLVLCSPGSWDHCETNSIPWDHHPPRETGLLYYFYLGQNSQNGTIRSQPRQGPAWQFGIVRGPRKREAPIPTGHSSGSWKANGGRQSKVPLAWIPEARSRRTCPQSTGSGPPHWGRSGDKAHLAWGGIENSQNSGKDHWEKGPPGAKAKNNLGTEFCTDTRQAGYCRTGKTTEFNFQYQKVFKDNGCNLLQKIKTSSYTSKKLKEPQEQQIPKTKQAQNQIHHRQSIQNLKVKREPWKLPEAGDRKPKQKQTTKPRITAHFSSKTTLPEDEWLLPNTERKIWTYTTPQKKKIAFNNLEVSNKIWENLIPTDHAARNVKGSSSRRMTGTRGKPGVGKWCTAPQHGKWKQEQKRHLQPRSSKPSQVPARTWSNHACTRDPKW